MSVERRVTSPFQGRNDGYIAEKKKVDPDTKDIIEYAVVDCVIKTGDNPEDFKIYKKVVEVGRKNRRKELNKYKSDVGCVNVIKKLARQGINAGDGRYAAPSGYMDATKLPQDLADTIKLSKEIDPKTSAIWKSIPAEMKKGMDLKTFAQKFNPGMVEEYVKAYTAKPAAKPAPAPAVQPKKEGE